MIVQKMRPCPISLCVCLSSEVSDAFTVLPTAKAVRGAPLAWSAGGVGTGTGSLRHPTSARGAATTTSMGADSYDPLTGHNAPLKLNNNNDVRVGGAGVGVADGLRRGRLLFLLLFLFVSFLFFRVVGRVRVSVFLLILFSCSSCASTNISFFSCGTCVSSFLLVSCFRPIATAAATSMRRATFAERSGGWGREWEWGVIARTHVFFSWVFVVDRSVSIDVS